MADFKVSLSPYDAFDLMQKTITQNTSAEMIDWYRDTHPTGAELVVAVFEKYYMRTDNRASLTVTLQNLSGVTEVHCIGSGGGQGLVFRFDWGVGDNFSEAPREALRHYIIR